MFAPSREQVRRFFFDTWSKYRAGTPLQGLEPIAVDVILLHPEYRTVLEAPEHTAERDYTPEMGTTNPFLHMSLHLAIEEQLSIDQPPGICEAFNEILHKAGSRHDALHIALECLGEMMWESQKNGTAPDGQRYLECLRGVRSR